MLIGIRFVSLRTMARKLKQILKDGVDTRDVGYYSTPGFVAQYLYEEMVKLNPKGSSVLDPAVGKGELTKSFCQAGYMVDGYDIVDYKGRAEKVRFNHYDFISKFIEEKDFLKRMAYDFIIMNPPYNCHEHTYIVRNRAVLHKHFKIGTYNMYALFMEAVLEIAKIGCVIGAILPDSLLFTPAYDKLRAKIMHDYEICQIVLCPTHLFRHYGANVNTCILLLRKGRDYNNKIIHVANRCADIASFKSVLRRRKLVEFKLEEIYLRINRGSKIFVFDFPNELIRLFSDCSRLDECFNCGGGISTGNNQLYTSSSEREGFDVPFYHNISSRFTALPGSFLCSDFLEQSRGIRNFIVRHTDHLNCDGIVCSGIGKRFYAAYLPQSGVTGVNATIWPGKEDVHWLLSYLNSSLSTYLLKGIIARSNITTIGNVSSLPILKFSESEKKALSRISKKAINGELCSDDAVFKIDRIVYKHINASTGTRKKIARFCADIIHLV